MVAVELSVVAGKAAGFAADFAPDFASGAGAETAASFGAMLSVETAFAGTGTAGDAAAGEGVPERGLPEEGLVIPEGDAAWDGPVIPQGVTAALESKLESRLGTRIRFLSRAGLFRSIGSRFLSLFRSGVAA